VTRIFDEWETHTPIDPSLVMMVRREASTATPTPPPAATVKTAKRIQATPAQSLKRVKLKVSARMRPVIVMSLCGAAVIALALLGFNSSYVQQQIVSATTSADHAEQATSVVKPATQVALVNTGSASNETVKIADDNRQTGSRAIRQGIYQEAVLEVFVRPVYPPQAQKMHVQGDVAMKLKIGEDGGVRGIKVLSGEPALATAAKEAAQQWRYRPALLNGAPVSAETKTVLTFRVSDSSN
jgi:TonB family protein